MATTIIDERYKIYTTVGPSLYMWTHYLATYENITRSGNKVTLSGVCMKAWWEKGTTDNFIYYGTISYGFELLIDNKVVASVSRTHAAGETYREGTVLAEECGITVTFEAEPGQTTIPVKIRGTGGVAGDESSGNVTFYIPPAVDPPGPPSGSLSCSTNGANGGNITLSGVSFDCPAGNECHNSTRIVLKNGGTTVASTNGTRLNPTNLQPNTKYAATGTVSNGEYSKTSTCSFTTQTSSSPFGYRWRTDQVSQMSVNVDKGGNACATTTKVYIREIGGSWQQVYSTSGYGIETFQIRDIIVRGKSYEAKTESTNCAGTYVSPTYKFAPPAADNIIGTITSIDSELEEESKGQSALVHFCWQVTSALLAPVSEENPIMVSIQYRVKGETDWADTDAVTVTTSTKMFCGDIPHMPCGVDMEFRLYMQNNNSNTRVYSAIRTVSMAMCADVNACTCDTFNYMTELICQEFNRMKSGMKTMYANCDTKDFCDPYSKNPTWVSTLSRIVRFFQAIACILCSMDTLNFVEGEDDDIYTATEPGKYGAWQKMVGEAVEGEGKLLTSDGAKKAIDYFVSSVWHPIGRYDYFVWDEKDIPTEAPEPQGGETLVIGTHWYEYKNNAWVDKGEIPDLDPFGTIVITKGTDYANHEFYWFADEWNLLDFEKGPTYEKLLQYESKDDLTINDQAGGMKIQHNIASFDYSTLPCERTVCFVVEDMDLPPLGSHRVTFPTAQDATIIQYQDVVDGGLAQKPEDPTRTGYTFVGWKNGNTGSTFNWDAPIHEDVEVIAEWTPQVVAVTFDLAGGEGTAPDPITAHYGDVIAALPDNTGFNYPGATFHGWARDGVPFTSTTKLVGDTVLTAIWHMSEFDVTFHPENGDENVVVHITYGSAPAKPADPTKDLFLFTGWYTSPEEGTGAPFSFDTLLYGPTNVYARWIKAKYDVVFDSAGGSAVPTQLVPYQTRAQRPTNPTKEDYVFAYWMLGGQRYNFDQEVVEDITLVAKWLGIYTVKFEDTFGDTIWADQTIVEGNTVNTAGKTEPSRDGYVFDGWYKKSDNTKWDIDTDLVVEDMTLVAVFTKNDT